MASLSDVAARAGVSISVASRALSGDPAARLSESTRARVRSAADDLSYRPNHAGRSLRRSRTDVIALVVPDVTNALFAELTRGVEDEAAERELTVLLGRSEDIGPQTAMIDRLVGEGRVDGIIVQARDGVPLGELGAHIAAGAAIVSVHDELAGASAVLIDDAAAVTSAVTHVVERGHRRIGLIGGLAESASARRREDGFRRAVQASGLDVRDDWITSLGYRPEDGRDAARLLLSGTDRPTALVVANVNAGFGVLAGAYSVNAMVPGDVAVVAVHDAWTTEYTAPALTCVRTPLYELGRAAVSALAARIEGAEPRTFVVTSPAPLLIPRASTID